MDIKLNYLHLSNFKGIKDFKLVADGKNVSIYGNNAVGKTSIIDGFMWVLFDRDNNGNSDTKFDIKPQDSLGRDINHLQTVVEVELSIDGKPLKLKKMREEKWVTRRGTSNKVFDKHEKSYWFDEVPVKAREYQSKVDELVNENIFKMITDPLYFNTQMKWEERRNILLEISGDATDEEVIASDESLSKLTELLGNRTIEEYKLVLADQLKNYKKDRDDLPPRIDELTLSLPQEEPDYTATELESKKHKDELATVEFLLTNATNKANKITEKYQELAKLKNQLEETKAKIKSEEGTGRQEALDKQQELNEGLFILKGNIQTLENQIEGCIRNAEYGEKELIRLRAEWTELSKKKQEILAQTHNPSEIESHCPTCKQELPEEVIENKLADLKINFDKAIEIQLERTDSDLEQNQTQGKATKLKVDQAIKDKELVERELEEKKTALEKLQGKLEKVSQELNQPQSEPDYTKYQEVEVLVESILQTQEELDKPVEDKSGELLQQKAEIQAKIDELNKVLNAKEEVEKKKSRIKKLKAEEKRVSTVIAELEGHKFMLERFTVAKVNLLEDSINSQFKHVRFRLFEENITNEGIKPTCIALINTNGSYVDFNTNGNSAGKINAGIDVITSLSRFYEVTAPIFVDNAESVTDLADTDSQVIRLVKPEIRDEEDRKKYSQLVVEVEE